MSSELQASYLTQKSCYFLVRLASNGQIWNSATGMLEVYNSTNYSGYTISASEQGTESAYYVGNQPPSSPAGTYNAVMKQQLGAFPAESDPTVDAGSLDWAGSGLYNVSDIAVSGTISPVQLQRNTMIPNYPIYLRSSADHITPFTSGTVSGQISKDGGSFSSLQSGAFTEVGMGFYSLQALTSGDLTANTINLLFTATNMSGGSSDPLPQSFILQNANVSGSLMRLGVGITGTFGG